MPSKPKPAAPGRTIELSLGPLCDKLKVQIRRQGFRFDPVVLEHYEKDREAIGRLHMRGYMGAQLIERMIDKLRKNILAHVRTMN